MSCLKPSSVLEYEFEKGWLNEPAFLNTELVVTGVSRKSTVLGIWLVSAGNAVMMASSSCLTDGPSDPIPTAIVSVTEVRASVELCIEFGM